VSCKNREKPVGADAIHQEAGRVSSLREEPDLKVIVAPSFSEGAKAAARVKGFELVELGVKVTEENAHEAFDILRERFKQLVELAKLSKCARRLVEEGLL
jgi:hypothetical protein